MLTRSQAAAARFRNVLENPVVLSHVVSHMSLADLSNMLLVSKDQRYREVLEGRLQTYKKTIEYLRNKMNEHNRCTTDEHRKETAIVVFTYLCDNQWMLTQNPRFHAVVMDKLKELSDDPIFEKEGALFFKRLSI